MDSIKKNFIYNSSYQILLIILPLITSPYISRVLGPSGIGTYSFTYSIANYFVLFAMLGVNNYGNRSIAFVRDDRKKLSETFWGIYYLQLFLSIIISIVYLTILLMSSIDYKFIYILQFMYVLSAAFDINWFCFGLEKFKITVIRNVIIRLLTVIAIFSFVKTEDDLWIYTLLMAGSILLSQFVIWPFVIKNVDFVKPSFEKIKNHFKPNLVLFVPVIAVSLYKIMDKIMLGLLSEVEEVGYYYNTESIILIPMGIITALGTVMLPRMSNLVAKGQKNESKLMIEKSMLFITFISSALMFGIAGISSVFAPWFFGVEFKETGELIMFMAPSIIFISWANVIRTQYLIPNSKDKVYIVSVLSGAIINLVLNFILIPPLGALGAVIGTVFAEITVCGIQTFMVRKELDIRTFFYNGIPFLFIGLIMFVLVSLIVRVSPSPTIVLIVQITVGGIVYLILSLVYLVILKKRSRNV